MYEGQFEEGEAHGKGKFTDPEGATFEGDVIRWAKTGAYPFTPSPSSLSLSSLTVEF